VRRVQLDVPTPRRRREPGRAPAPLPRDQPISAALKGTNKHGLQNTALANRTSQRLQRRLIKVTTRLDEIRLDQPNRQLPQLLRCRRCPHTTNPRIIHNLASL
jgi:hypothetical protein